ncbi:MAG: maleylpyruvate isomerase family mycothiol-dependent enzyme [Actinobacteria bacterium]|nr:MAG: maleylpyruvate isomerase family mycothiol-dependent enzyme [Actinomycetota bacterium]
MTGDATWDFLSSLGKPRVLEVLDRQAEAMFALAGDPANWHVPTACAGWDVGDMVGHLVDATEASLSAFDFARRGATAPDAVGVAGMAAATDEAARAMRSVPRDELLARLRDRTAELMAEFESLADAEWSGLVVPDPYMGPLPASVVATGLLGGYTVHGWDVREGLGLPHEITGDAADLLVPFVFLLWWATADTSSVDEPFAIGIRTTGVNGGDTRFDVSPTDVRFAAGTIDDCAATLELDPGTLVLTAYNRINGGTIRGDERAAARFRSLFVTI